MKKALRKLIPTFVMVLLAATMVGTSTYAWFSMNKTVSVTGMQVEVKSDETYLLVNTGDNDTYAEIQTAGLKTVALTVSDGDAKIYPASPALTAAEAAYLSVAEGHNKVGGGTIETAGVVVDNATKAAAVTNWFTANASAPNAAAIDTSTAKQLTSFTGYVITRTAYLTVAAGANGANNLHVTPTFAQKGVGNDLAAAKALVVTSDGGFAVLSSTNNGSSVDISGSNTTLTSTTVLTVTIYIYYDGDETPVNTNNKANLTGATISLAFDVSPVAAA